MNSEQILSNLARINNLVLALTECAYDDGSWEKHQRGVEGRNVVADRLENRITELIREIEKELQEVEK